jgi:hypothetical protein
MSRRVDWNIDTTYQTTLVQVRYASVQGVISQNAIELGYKVKKGAKNCVVINECRYNEGK